MINSKKGGVFDLMVAIILSFITVLCLILFFFMGNTINTQIHNQIPVMQNGTPENVTNVTEIVNKSVGAIPTAFNNFIWIAPMFIFGFFLSMIISSFVVKQHPAWLFGYIMIWVICIILSVPLSNTYQTLMTNGTLASTFYSFMLSNWIFIYLPLWVTVFGGVAGVVMFANIEW